MLTLVIKDQCLLSRGRLHRLSVVSNHYKYQRVFLLSRERLHRLSIVSNRLPSDIVRYFTAVYAVFLNGVSVYF